MQHVYVQLSHTLLFQEDFFHDTLSACFLCLILYIPSQAPVLPLQRNDGPSFNQLRQNEAQRAVDHPLEQGIPTIITWSLGGNNVAVEGSWDNWRTRCVCSFQPYLIDLYAYSFKLFLFSYNIYLVLPAVKHSKDQAKIILFFWCCRQAYFVTDLSWMVK